MMVSPEILTAPVSVTFVAFSGTHIIFSTVAMYICNILLVNYHSSLNSEPLLLLALYPGPSHVKGEGPLLHAKDYSRVISLHFWACSRALGCSLQQATAMQLLSLRS